MLTDDSFDPFPKLDFSGLPEPQSEDEVTKSSEHTSSSPKTPVLQHHVPKVPNSTRPYAWRSVENAFLSKLR